MTKRLQWLATRYHFPGVYSIRAPISSMSSAQSLPAPGPATVRLALIRVGIELFGAARTKSTLFPTIRAMPVRIAPSAKIAFTNHHLRAYKGSKNKNGAHLVESITYREFAQTDDDLTIFIQVPQAQIEQFARLLRGIAYWGQQSSLAVCRAIEARAPVAGSYGVSLAAVAAMQAIQRRVTSLVAEFKTPRLSWESIQPKADSKANFLEMHLYVWPLVVSERRNGQTILKFHPLENVGFT